MRCAYGMLALLALSSAAGCDRSDPAGEDAKRIEQIDETWRTFSRCLVGKPLTDKEKPSSRMRMAELTVLVQGGKDYAEWPSQCAQYTKPLLEQLGTLAGDAAVDSYAPLAEALRKLEGVSVDVYIANEKAPLIDALWEAARSVGLEPIAADAPPLRDGPSAPKPAEPIALAKLLELGPSESYVERSELAPGGTVRFTLGGGDAASLFCSIGSNKGPLDQARCQQLEGDVSSSIVPLSAQAPDADWYFDLKPKRAVHALTGSEPGKTIEAPFTQSAFVFDDGMVADVFEGDRGRPTLLRSLPSGKLERAPMQTPGGAKWLGFRGGAIVWRGPIRGAAGRPVMVQDVQEGRVALGGRIELGEVPPDIEDVEGCRNGKDVTIALIGAHPKNADDEPERTVAMVFRKGEGDWSRSKWVAAKLGKEPHPWAERWWRTMTCRPGEATFTYLRPDDRVGQVRCTPEGCDAKLTEPVSAAGKVLKARVTSLGDKVLLLRVVRTSAPMTGVTDVVVMRFGKVSELSAMSDAVVVSDEDHEGVKGVGKSLGLVATGDAAVALIHSDKKLFGVRIDAEGKLSALSKR